MQSRLAAKLNRQLLFLVSRNQCFLPQRLVSASVGRTADPDVHAGELEGDDAEQAKRAETATGETELKQSTTVKPPFSSSKSPQGSSQKIESRGVNDPVKPNTQQKRHSSTNAAAADTPPPISDVSCVGFDGGPWPDDATDQRSREDDDREYYKHQKASPLSEMTMADTRKPITRATDRTGGGSGDGVVVWRPEQLDTAEEALLRAMEIWKYNAARGDPDSPHGKVLRELRGEYW